MNNLIFLPFVVALLATAVITPLSLVILKKIGILDDPKVRRHPAIIHSKPIPRGGGIPLFLGALVASVLFLPLNKITGSIFLASFISLVIGVLDDKYDISPYSRFLVNIFSAIIVVYS